jgi:hypothetical protein
MDENPQDLRVVVERLQREVTDLRARLDGLSETTALIHEDLRRLYEEEVLSP